MKENPFIFKQNDSSQFFQNENEDKGSYSFSKQYNFAAGNQTNVNNNHLSFNQIQIWQTI